MKQKWLGLTWPQRVMIFLQAFLIVLFLILTSTIGRQQVISYRGEHLRRSIDGAIITYSGRIDGERAVFTVSPGPVVEYRRGDDRYGPYTIRFDPTAVSDNSPSHQWQVGVEVWEGETRLFRGSYQSINGFSLYDENGDYHSSSGIIIWAAGAEKTAADYAPGVSTILRVALAPNVVRRGSVGFYLLGVLICAANALSILYADALFRWNLRFAIRAPEDAEPSDWELFSQWVGWIVLTIAALALFIIGLNGN